MSVSAERDASRDVESMRSSLGIPAAPMVVEGLRAACGFFRGVLREDPGRWVDYFRGIDFHRRVEVQWLSTGTELSQHQNVGASREKPFVYFTKPGVSPTSTGTTFDRVVFIRYKVVQPVAALVSFAGAISFNNLAARRLDRVSRAGGGIQFIVSARDARQFAPLDKP